MGILSDDMKRVVREQTLGFVATVCPDGTPNVSPKGTTAVWDDDHLIFADLRSPQTMRNLRANPSVEINVVDPILRKGYRFKGTATIHAEGKGLEDGLAFFADAGIEAAHDRIKAVVIIKVEKALPLTSPAYDLGRTEDDLKKEFLRRIDDRLRPGTTT